MRMVTKVAAALQSLLGSWAEQAAAETGVIERRRKFSPQTLARTFVLGHLANPRASDEELAQCAAFLGVEVTPQAVEQRYTPRLEAFLEGLFRRGMGCLIGTQTVLAPLLERFAGVFLLDSSSVSLPAELAARFPGCGGRYGSGTAALKIQVLWDLCRGALQAIGLEAGRDCDYKTPLQRFPLPPGALRVSDLGYFSLDVFEALGRQGVFWLSRLQFGTAVLLPDGVTLRLLSWLAAQAGSVVDQPVRLGSQHRLLGRLVAWRVPAEVAHRRRQKLIQESRSRRGRTPTQERLAWCDWMILVSNVPSEKLSPQEAAVLYRSRWQIELLFKRWKSLGLVAELDGSTTARQMARLWARLIGVLVQHWFVLTSVWGDLRHSLAKATTAIRRHALLLTTSIGNSAALSQTIQAMCQALRATARQNPRRKPSTFQLLNDPSLLEWSLT